MGLKLLKNIFGKRTLFEIITERKIEDFWIAAGGKYIKTAGTDPTINSDGSLTSNNVDLKFHIYIEGIPNNATLMTAYVGSTQTWAASEWQLKRINIKTGASDVLANSNGSGRITISSNSAVDNTTYAYFFRIVDLAATKIVYGANVEYTVN